MSSVDCFLSHQWKQQWDRFAPSSSHKDVQSGTSSVTYEHSTAFLNVRGILEMAFLQSHHHHHPPTTQSGLKSWKNIFIVHVLVILAQHHGLHLNTVHVAFFLHKCRWHTTIHKNIPSHESVIKCGNLSLMCSTFNLKSIDILQTSRVRGHTCWSQFFSVLLFCFYYMWDLKSAAVKGFCSVTKDKTKCFNSLYEMFMIILHCVTAKTIWAAKCMKQHLCRCQNFGHDCCGAWV